MNIIKNRLEYLRQEFQKNKREGVMREYGEKFLGEEEPCQICNSMEHAESYHTTEKVCRKCRGEIAFETVSDGYFGVCLECDEDFYEFELVKG